MRIRNGLTIRLLAIVVGICRAFGQDHALEVDASASLARIQPTMYGIFFEDINFAADGGLYAEMIKNRSFEFTEPKIGWAEPNSDRFTFNENSGIASIVKYAGNTANHNYCRVRVNNAGGYELINEGFRGMGIKEGAMYNFSMMASAHEGKITKILLSFIDAEGNSLGGAGLSMTDPGWTAYTARIVALKTDEKARLKITFEGTGSINLDMISLFPEDTWKGRKNGLRKDIVQLLSDMHPGFLRFPGGCIVEGRTLATRYQWKKTVGPVEDRESLINRWNTEFTHRPAPDYYQSFGLGFFEYFQVAEDLGAEPLPILSCGMACQFNTAELVPLEALDPYVQDALDLIEFANGGTDTPWGRIRKEMGHPEVFDMKFIGIGNEQWGPEYIERYKVFEEAIKSRYPEVIIVSGSGPFPKGDYFEYGNRELKKLNAEIIDEHYYKPPEWFRENATRYDGYDRNGPKIFAGEYAAQSVAIASPDNKNNWECALSEAAFMTGLERNASVVYLTSYAPLMAHADGWQWTPDLIWFNNLDAYGTPNYYVQKLFSTNKGTDLISVVLDGQQVVGQHDLFATAVKDRNRKEIIVKLVNTSTKDQEVSIRFKGAGLGSKGELQTLSAENLADVNSFDFPEKIHPVTKSIPVSSARAGLTLKKNSLSILKLAMR